MARPLLNSAEQGRITEAIKAAESTTSGEIVPVVVHASDNYSGARWRVAFAFALVVGAAVVYVFPKADALFLVAGLVPALVIGHLLAQIPWVLRIALNKREVTEEVRQRAFEAFLEFNVHTTRDRTGVMILVSKLEQRIEILCDTGINAKAPEGYWNDVVRTLSARIERGELAEGLCEAVQTVGALLTESFPRLEDDVNELADEVVLGD